jgi:hypothetical protein
MSAPDAARHVRARVRGLLRDEGPPLTTTRGVRIEAVYVFTTTLTKLIADEKPSHVVACFDKGLPQARVAIYSAYKAQRETMPDELRSQFSLVRRVLDVYAHSGARGRRRRGRRRDRDPRRTSGTGGPRDGRR